MTLSNDNNEVVKSKTAAAAAESTNKTCRPPLPPLVQIRILYVFFYASISCIQPFMGVYFDALGYGSETTGVLLSLRPIATILCAPLWGSLADFSGRKREILMFAFVGCVLTRLLLLAPARQNVTFLVTAYAGYSVFYSALKSLIDSTAMACLSPGEKHKFGRIRLWGQIGTGVSSSVVGMWISKSSEDFEMAFIASTLISLLALACMLSLPNEKRTSNCKAASISTHSETFDSGKIPPTTPAPALTSHCQEIGSNGVIELLRDKLVVSFFLNVLLCGFSIGTMESFAYVQIRQSLDSAIDSDSYNGAGVTMALCRVGLSVGGVALFWYSGALQQRFAGQTNMVFTGITVSLGICLWLYSLIGNENDSGHQTYFMVTVTAITAEVLRGASVALYTSIATIYAHQLSPLGMTAVMLTSTESIYRLGYTSSSYLGGKLISNYGSASTMFSYICKVVLTLSSTSIFGKYNIGTYNTIYQLIFTQVLAFLFDDSINSDNDISFKPSIYTNATNFEFNPSSGAENFSLASYGPTYIQDYCLSPEHSLLRISTM